MQAVEGSLYQLVGHEPAEGEPSRTGGPVIKERPVKQQTTQPLGKSGPFVQAWQLLIGWLMIFLVSPVRGRRM